MGEAPVIRWRISSIGYLPPRLGEAFLFSGSRERELATHRPLGSFLEDGFYSCPTPASYPSKRLHFCSFQLLYLQFSQAARSLCSNWDLWNSAVNHLHSLPITSPHSSPHSFNNHVLRANQWSSPELGMALREKHKTPAIKDETLLREHDPGKVKWQGKLQMTAK